MVTGRIYVFLDLCLGGPRLLYSHDNLQKETSPIIYHLLKCTYHLSVTQGENRAGYVVGVNQNRFTTSWECLYLNHIPCIGFKCAIR